MPIYEISADEIREVPRVTFSDAGLLERQDLQRLLRSQIDIVSTDTLVIAEEFGSWEDSRRRIDLLAIDRDANLIVIELKRTEDGGHMELQALRYAAMVSTLTFDRAVEVFSEHLERTGQTGDARDQLLQFLEWDGSSQEEFGRDVRILLASAEFSKELTSTVLWLNDRGIDIRCIRLRPHRYEGRVLLDVAQLIPLPEAEQYQIQIREKRQKERRPSRRWTEEAFLRDLEGRCSPKSAELARKLLAWGAEEATRIYWGEGSQTGAFAPILEFSPRRAQRYHLFHAWSRGRVVVRGETLHKREALADGSLIAKLYARLASISGVEAAENPTSRQIVPMEALLPADAQREFFVAMTEFVHGIRSWYEENRAELIEADEGLD